MIGEIHVGPSHGTSTSKIKIDHRPEPAECQHAGWVIVSPAPVNTQLHEPEPEPETEMASIACAGCCLLQPEGVVFCSAIEKKRPRGVIFEAGPIRLKQGRFLVLTSANLRYFKSENQYMNGGAAKNCIPVDQIVGINRIDATSFEIDYNVHGLDVKRVGARERAHEPLKFSSHDEAIVSAWVQVFAEVLACRSVSGNTLRSAWARGVEELKKYPFYAIFSLNNDTTSTMNLSTCSLEGAATDGSWWVPCPKAIRPEETVEFAIHHRTGAAGFATGVLTFTFDDKPVRLGIGFRRERNGRCSATGVIAADGTNLESNVEQRLQSATNSDCRNEFCGHRHDSFVGPVPEPEPEPELEPEPVPEPSVFVYWSQPWHDTDQVRSEAAGHVAPEHVQCWLLNLVQHRLTTVRCDLPCRNGALQTQQSPPRLQICWYHLTNSGHHCHRCPQTRPTDPGFRVTQSLHTPPAAATHLSSYRGVNRPKPSVRSSHRVRSAARPAGTA